MYADHFQGNSDSIDAIQSRGVFAHAMQIINDVTRPICSLSQSGVTWGRGSDRCGCGH